MPEEFRSDVMRLTNAVDPSASVASRQPATNLQNILCLPVGVVVAPTLQVPELGRLVGGGMTDAVARADAVGPLQGAHQGQDRTDLGRPVEDLLIGPVRTVTLCTLDDLDADRFVVQANRVTAHHTRRDDLPHVPALRHDEMRAGARQLPQVRRVVGEPVAKPCGPTVLEGLGAWDLVVEPIEADGVVGAVDRAVVGVVDRAVVGAVDRVVVGVVDGTLAPAPAQPATINVTTAAPATERAAYRRCCPTGTQASEPNDAKWSKLGMMTW